MKPASAKNVEERGQRVRYIRDRLLGFSREQFCYHSNISVHSLKAWELAWGGGLTENGAKKLVQHAKTLGIYASVAWLLHGIGNTPALITKNFNICEEEVEHIAKELLVFKELPGSIDMLIQDDAMAPYLHPGNYVAGIIVDDLEKALDNACIIVDTDNNYYVRLLKQGDKADHYHLSCLNPNPTLAKKEIHNVQIEFAAPIIWIRKPEIRD